MAFIADILLVAGALGAGLADVNARAEASARRLELLIASLHDLPAEKPTPQSPFFVRPAEKPEPVA